jgi:hypothetical protein
VGRGGDWDAVVGGGKGGDVGCRDLTSIWTIIFDDNKYYNMRRNI